MEKEHLWRSNVIQIPNAKCVRMEKEICCSFLHPVALSARPRMEENYVWDVVRNMNEICRIIRFVKVRFADRASRLAIFQIPLVSVRFRVASRKRPL